VEPTPVSEKRTSADGACGTDGPRAARETVVEPRRDSSSARRMQTFRLPRELLDFLRTEADQSGRDLTAQVVQFLEGIRTHFGLPAAAAALLEADRRALRMDRLQYLLHTLYRRSLSVRENGAGFDAPNGGERRGR
jgi:hypothetical protein